MSPIALRALAALNSDSDSSSEEEDMEIDKPAQKGLDAVEIENLASDGKDEVGEDTSPSGDTQIMIPSLPPLPVVPSPGYNVADDTAQLDNAKLQKSGDDTLLSDMNTEEEMKNDDIYQVCSLADGEEDVKSTKEPAKKKRRVPEEKSKKKNKRKRVPFQQRLDELKAYKDEHGHTRVKKSEDKSLFKFCQNIRYAHNHPDKSTVVVNEERIALLNALGFEWVVKEQFDIRLDDLKAYKKKNGHLNVRKEEDPSLYNFCNSIRTSRNNTGKPGKKLTKSKSKLGCHRV